MKHLNAVWGIVAILALVLPISNQANASDPLSPNRLVFNQLPRPTTDANGDGEVNIFDIADDIPPNVDAIVYIGADTEDEVFMIDGNGVPVVNFASSAVNRLQNAITLATNLDVPLYIRGHFALTDAIQIRGAVSISGYSAKPAVIHSVVDNCTTLINIESGTTDVVIEKVRLNEVIDLSVSMVLLSGKNERITIDEVEFTGQRVGAIFHTTAAIYMFRDWIKDVWITNCKISDFQYGIHCVCGVRGLMIHNNQFRRWTNFAVRIARIISNDHLRTEDVSIIDNDFRDPRAGLFNSVIFITRNESLLYIRDVKVNRNTIFSDGGAFQLGNSTSNATGDQIVLHGVNGFQIADNLVFHGGENGITASTLSRNGIIASNVVHGNDTHGIVVGSGFYELSVSKAAKIKVNDRIEGVESGANAIVQSIRVHPSDGRTILGLGQVAGGRIFRNEMLDNLTSGVNGVAQASIVDRTKGISVVENYIFGNGLDQANNTPFTFGIFLQNADSIDIRRNTIFNLEYEAVREAGGVQDQRQSVFLSNSRNILVSENNSFERGAETITEGLGKNASSWLR